jgi:membrane protein
MTIGGIEVVPFAKRLAREFGSDDVSGLAAELSYRYFLALFPFLIFLAGLGGFIADVVGANDPTGSVMRSIGDALPPDARSVLETQVRSVLKSHSAGLLSFGIIAAIWASSGAMKAMIKAMNRAYNVPETRSFWQTTLLAIGMTVAATIGIVGALIVYASTTGWVGTIAGWFGAGRAFEVAVLVARWPLIVLLVLGGVGLLYRLAPNLYVPFKWITPGSVLFTTVWIGATLGFGLYVTHFGSYNKTYGALGGVVVLMTWLYLTNFLLLAGAELNAMLDAELDPQKLAERRAPTLRSAALADGAPLTGNEGLGSIGPRQPQPSVSEGGTSPAEQNARPGGRT